MRENDERPKPASPGAAPRHGLTPDAAAPLRFPLPRHTAADRTGASALPLAHGDLSAEDAAELTVLQHQIHVAIGLNTELYKEKCLRRRLAVRMRARGVHTYSQYASLLRRDRQEYVHLLDTVTINVSKFFRNPEVWDVVREMILPDLFALPAARINVWSAGCASGEEPYTIAMLFQDYAEKHGLNIDRLRVTGTDLDREVLAAALRAEYSQFAMTDISPEMRAKFFESGPLHKLKPEARKNVTFRELDLIKDPFPEKQHMIFCRNVIIYFERSLQEELFARFHQALVPGGYLVLGKVEAMFGKAATMFRPLSNRHRVFRKV
jgi:chemotaxis protein methyltransferase CheR